MGFPCLIWPYCIQFEWYQPKYCLHFWVDGLSVKAYVPLMKPLIPNDATAKALGAGADPDREDLSLHDEILTRLRDHIVMQGQVLTVRIGTGPEGFRSG